MIGKEVLNYRIVSLIGEGGMGSVWLAEHKFIANQKVAIKVIHADMVNDWTRSRLKEEAEHLAGLRHGNIVAFHDYHIDEEGNIYLIMEYAEGKSLEDYIRTQSGLIVQERVCPLFEPILDAVGYAHKHNILHRDIKPSNVVITTEGIPKILDFGIATVIKRDSTAASDKFIVGTPSYMSPEQVRGEQLDERSDIYSLGVMLHVMLTGNPPYDTTTLTETEIHQKIVEEPLPRLRSFYKYVSEPVQKVVDKATAKNPADRYRSCAEFKQALHNAVYPPKRNKGVIVGLVALLLVAAGAGAWLWDYNRLKVEYFRDYVEQWGVPQGIGKVSADQQKQRMITYRFESQKGKLRKVKIVNSKGHPCTEVDTEFFDRPSEQQIFYTDDGHIDYVKILDQHGKVLYRKDYNDNLTVAIFQYDDQYNTELTLGSNDITYGTDAAVNTEDKSRISRHLLTYDERGFVVKREYAGPYNKKVGDKSGVYGQAYLLDDKGRVIESQYLGFDGQPRALKNGLSIRTYHYNDLDEWDETHYLTMSRSASDNGQDLTVIKIEYDEFGNRKAERYYDLEGNMTYRTDMYVAGIIYEISNGEAVLYHYVDINNNPTHTKDGYYYKSYEYDANGYMSKGSYLDENRQPVLVPEGAASFTSLNDDTGNQLEVWNYDEHGTLAANKDGIAGFKLEYDSVGNNLQIMTFDDNRQHTKGNHSFYGRQYRYNDKNQIVKEIYIDSLGNPMIDDNGKSINSFERDVKGNIVRVEFYDTDDSTLVNTLLEKIAGYTNSYDENGNLIKRDYFDAQRQPAKYSGLYASFTRVYDENNYQIAYYCYGLNGELVLNEDNIAGCELVVDERGNEIENVPLGTDGKLKSGRLMQRFKYDSQGRVIESAVFNANGIPVLNSQKVHKYASTYNEYGQLSKTEAFDTKGNLTLSSQKAASETYKYDNMGRLIETISYDKKGNPCTNVNGYASKVVEYDKFGRMVKESYFDPNGNPTVPKNIVPVGIVGYDEYGNMNYIAAQDGHGNFILNPKTGYSIMRMVYDKNRNVVEQSYYSAADKPMVVKNGAHKQRYNYNSRHQITQKAYFNTSDKPMLVEGVHLIKYAYDDNGHLLSESYYGLKGNPINNNNGYHKFIYKTKVDGTPIAATLYNIKGKVVMKLKKTPSGWKVESLSAENSSQQVRSENTPWKTYVEQLNKVCPIDMGDQAMNIVIESAKVTSANSCLIKLVYPKAGADITDNENTILKNVVQVIAQNFYTQLNTKGVNVVVSLYSSDGNLKHTASYNGGE